MNDYPEVSLQAEELSGKIDFCHIFGRSGIVHIEIGSGRGAFLLNQARAMPGDNFLGIEKTDKFFRIAVDRVGRGGLKNVRIIRTDASAFLAEVVPDESVDCFHIYFPDPWPKRRQQRRRFICPANIELMVCCLKKGGRLQIATDHVDYFEQIKMLLGSMGERLEQSEFIPAAGAEPGESVGTSFERKYLKCSRQIYTLAFTKISNLKA